jgi:hypothetical protein
MMISPSIEGANDILDKLVPFMEVWGIDLHRGTVEQ